MLLGKITLREFGYRLISIFDKRLCRIPEILCFDAQNAIPSTFFFGMDNILGMSYKKDKVIPWIHYVEEQAFDVGVHGVAINDIKKIANEYEDFKRISHLDTFGIRTHYVRYDSTTFLSMEKVGYLFDSSEFNKSMISLKQPYKVGTMWEFPLHIMDGYVMRDGLLKAQEKTIEALLRAEQSQVSYIVMLFHDYMFNDKTYPQEKTYYEWFVNYCRKSGYEFISYRAAIEELNSK